MNPVTAFLVFVFIVAGLAAGYWANAGTARSRSCERDRLEEILASAA
jgi:hypothetical protein